MTKLSLIEVLDDLLEVRDILLACKTKDEAIQTALGIVRERLHSQTASIFLFSKDGRLERAGIQGIGLDGEFIANNWFSEESYAVGESFTGQVVVPRKSSVYGEPQWFDNPDKKRLNDESQSKYLNKLGRIRCAIGVPLNGQNRTYGVLEIINKLNPKALENISCSSFSREEIYWLAAIGANLATSISNLRRNNQIKMLTELGSLLVEAPSDRSLIFQTTSEQIVKKLLNPDTSFKVCILRIGAKPTSLTIIAKDKVESVTWEGRKDEEREYGTGLVGKAADSGEPVIVERIGEEISKFHNQEWIKNNHLGSFACFPLVTKDEVVGAISLFAGYNYIFHDSIINLLKSVASLVASFTQRRMASEELRKLENQLSEERNARFISGYSLSREDILHEYKNELLILQNVFRELKERTSRRGLENSIDSQIEWIDQRVKSIQSQFEEYAPVPVSINQILQDVVKYFSHELRNDDKSICFSQSYDKQIPRIMANPVEIKEVIRNLISNSVKAIQKVGKGREIRLATTLVEVKGIDYIQITIEDDGIGIRKEIKNVIFEKGFTTYEDEGGTGIGLFIARKIINRYGGQCFYESVVGKGTLFLLDSL